MSVIAEGAVHNWMWRESNRPRPSPSREVERSPEHFRTRTSEEAATPIFPKRFRAAESLIRRLSRVLNARRPPSNSRIEPSLTVTPSRLSNATPKSQKSWIGSQAESGVVIAIDRVAVEVERDVIGGDDDPVVRAVDEVVVERRVGGDRRAAAHVAGGRLTGAGGQETPEGQHKERE